MKKIASLQNPQIKGIKRLRKSSERKEKNKILIEGHKEIQLAQDSGLVLETLVFSPEFAKDKSPDTLLTREVIEVSPAVFKSIAYREHPDGFLGVAKPQYLALGDIKLSDSPLLVVLETVEKPGNLGAILRTADAVKADAVIICDSQTDIYNPNVIRASLGTIFTNQVVAGITANTIEWLREKGIRAYATTPDTNKIYTDAEYLGPSAIIIGAEHDGLSQDWLKAAYQKIKIPIRGKIDSLNASVSAAVVLYEVLRQRSK